MNWQEKIVQLSELKPFERNPRRISKESFQQLKNSLQEDGYHQRIIATPDLRVVGGHQRIRALQELGFKEIPILIPDRVMTDDEFRRTLVRDNISFGEFDMGILSADYNFEEKN